MSYEWNFIFTPRFSRITPQLSQSPRKNAYAKKCKHFLMMVINYLREQTNLGLIKIDKIAGTKNNADLLTKKLRDGTFLPKRNARTLG